MKILFVSLGCDKNLSDTEMMMGMLEERGYSFTDDETEASAAIVNTCCFIGDAKEESIHTLLELGELRKAGRLKALIAAGCLAQRYRAQIRKEIPEVDALVGTMAIDRIADALEDALAGKRGDFFRDLNETPVARRDRVLTTGGTLRLFKNRGGLRKTLYILRYPQSQGGLPQHSHGTVGFPGPGTGAEGR